MKIKNGKYVCLAFLWFPMAIADARIRLRKP